MGEERAKIDPDTQSALAQVQADRLLDGEDPASTYPEDASHWIAVYSELLLFKERLVDAAEQNLRHITEPLARNEAAQVDLQVLLAQRNRLRLRLDFWKERRREISGSS